MEKFYTDVVFSLKTGQGSPLLNRKETIVDPNDVLSAGPAAAAIAAPVAGAVVGGLMNRQGGGGQQQMAVGTSSPWSAQDPHLRRVFGHALEEFRKPHQLYSGPFTAPQDPAAVQALSGIEKQVGMGYQNLLPGLEAIRETAAGAYLPGGGKDSLFDKAFQAKAAQLIPGVQSVFARGGRGRGGLAKLSTQKVLGEALGDQIAKERQRQLQAAAQLPGAEAAMYGPLGRLMDVAHERERVKQLGIDEAIQRHEHKYEEPWQRLGRYQAMIQGHYGGQQATPYFAPGRMQQMLGGALGGAQLGQQMYGAYQQAQGAFSNK